MRFVERLGKDNSVWGDNRDTSSPVGWDIPAVKALWRGIAKDFHKRYVKKKTKRKGELSWETPYKAMKNPQREPNQPDDAFVSEMGVNHRHRHG